MYRIGDIRVVHLEITSKCNARCPMCLRNVMGGAVNPYLPLTELRLEDIERIFEPNFIKQLNRLYMCGNYGDPIAAQDTLSAFEYFRRENSHLDLEIFTNGSGRPESWWRDLASVVNRCRFSVDGIGETNAIYRRGTDFSTIQRNMRAFIAAGGEVVWDFIVFRHNEHQVETARELAKTLGVRTFNVKKTARFFSNTKAEVKDRQEVLNSGGNVEYYLEPPQNEKYQNSALAKEKELIEKFGSLKDFFGQTPVDCKVINESSLYISAEGFAFPCCWTANQLYPWYYEERGAPIWKFIEGLPGGLQSLNAKENSLAKIIEGAFFQDAIPANWQKNSLKNGRLFVCGKTCGKGFDSFRAQFLSSEKVASVTS